MWFFFFLRKKESNASVLVPKGYEPVLGQITIESQNIVKINFYEPVFLDVTQGTFIHIGFLNFTTSYKKRVSTNRPCALPGYSWELQRICLSSHRKRPHLHSHIGEFIKYVPHLNISSIRNMVFIKSKHSTLVNAEYTLSTP